MAHAHTDQYGTSAACRVNAANEVEISVHNTRICLSASEARALAEQVLVAANTIEENEPKYEREEAA